MFTAIPVNQGDAFLLQRRNGPTILVDGGRSQRTFPFQLRSFIDGGVDVAVCTHADADHVNGLIGLLESSIAPVREVWLPGQLSERLADIVDPSWDTIDELVQNIAESDADSLEFVTLPERRPPSDGPTEGGEAVDLGSFVRGMVSKRGYWWDIDRRYYLHRRHGIYMTAAKQNLWFDAIDTADRIRRLAMAAHHHGARLRWFDHDLFSSQGVPRGGESFLRPLNSVEIQRKPAREKPSVLMALALTVSNRNSLVFAAPEQQDWSGVVFSADSDLDCSGHIPAFQRKAIITAPHHGSEANEKAYARAAKQMGSSLGWWIRSDGDFGSRPGATFKKQNPHQRRRTLCTGPSRAPKQPVTFHDGPMGWATASPACVCP
jgi:hypothetical protein